MKSVDTFKIKSQDYASYRPKYPQSLFEYLLNISPSSDIVLDCATGSGQAAISLSTLFKKVIAIDISKEQISHAKKHINIKYYVQEVENTNFEDKTFDLITVAQALHWFDENKFWNEMNRLLKPNGIFSAWGYYNFSIEPHIDKIIQELFIKPIQPFFSKKLQKLWNGYKDIQMPFDIIKPPSFFIEQLMYPKNIIDYLQTWSAYKRYIQNTQDETLGENTLNAIEKLWGKNSSKKVRMKLITLIGKKI